jgi:hypothetical protein
MKDISKVRGSSQVSPILNPEVRSTVLVAPEPFVDAEQAGTFLCIRPRRAVELARKGLLPAHPLGDGLRRVWRFRLSELASAVCERRVDCGRQSPAPRQETN